MIIDKLYIKDEHLKYQYTSNEYKKMNETQYIYEFNLYNTVTNNDILNYYFEVIDTDKKYKLYQIIPFNKELISFNSWNAIYLNDIENKNNKVQFIFSMYENSIYQYDIVIQLNLNIQIEIPIHIKNDIEIDLILNHFKEKSLLKSLNYLFENNNDNNYNQYIKILSCKKLLSKYYRLRLNIKTNHHYSSYYVNNLLKCLKFIKDNNSMNYNQYYNDINNYLHFLIDNLLEIENIYIYKDTPLINGVTINISKKSHNYHIHNLIHKKIDLSNNIITSQNQKEIELILHLNTENSKIVLEDLDKDYYKISDNKIDIKIDNTVKKIDVTILNHINKIDDNINIYNKDKYTFYTNLNQKTLNNVKSYYTIFNIFNSDDKRNSIIICIFLLLFTEILRKMIVTNNNMIKDDIQKIENTIRLNQKTIENSIFQFKKINHNINKYN